jgi:two-component system chemotaxis response regulator CheY
MAHGKSILIVDDSAAVRLQLRQALEDSGFSVLEAENGAKGLAIARESTVDLMIVDLNMPVMGGIEMIAKTRVLKEYKSTPIFVLTTESAASTVREGKAAGVTAWIVKPVHPDVLVKGIRAVLGV